MKASEVVSEITHHGKFPDKIVSKDAFQTMLSSAEKVAQVRKNVRLMKDKNYYFLVRGETEILGAIEIKSTKEIHGDFYHEFGVIYVFPEYRKTSAAHWLIYSVKEELKYPVIVDGALFADGKELVNSVIGIPAFHAKKLNKITGEISALTEPVNDPNIAYIFEQNKLGYKASYFGGIIETWLTPIEDQDTI